MSEITPDLTPRKRDPISRAAVWIWTRLFGSLVNSLLTLIMVWILYRVISVGLDWLIFDATLAPADVRQCIDNGGACWAFLQAKWQLILFGTYPYELRWRPGLALILFAGLVIASCLPRAWSTLERRRWMAVLWLLGMGVIIVLMAGGLGFREVEIRLWSGLPLTVMLAAVGMVSAFFLAVALALGRRSDLPAVRWLCIGYIELIRGVPLISLLFMANIMLPLLLPSDLRVPNLLRAQLAFILFFAAYMAETIRGGLQALPEGQYSAAKALGLNYWQRMIHVIMPQALRLVIPSLVNIFIGGFKDTSLVIVISMLDLLGTANSAKADPAWLGLFVEAYFFIAVIYLFVCAGMSWYSRQLERRLRTTAERA
ncbi:MAG: amino acid ABC transporter permease [Rhodospirillales bacterium]